MGVCASNKISNAFLAPIDPTYLVYMLRIHSTYSNTMELNSVILLSVLDLLSANSTWEVNGLSIVRLDQFLEFGYLLG